MVFIIYLTIERFVKRKTVKMGAVDVGLPTD